MCCHTTVGNSEVSYPRRPTLSTTFDCWPLFVASASTAKCGRPEYDYEAKWQEFLKFPLLSCIQSYTQYQCNMQSTGRTSASGSFMNSRHFAS